MYTRTYVVDRPVHVDVVPRLSHMLARLQGTVLLLRRFWNSDVLLANSKGVNIYVALRNNIVFVQ